MKLLILLACCLLQTNADGSYWEKRRALIEIEDSMAIGGNVELSTEEKRANETIMALKMAELEDGFKNPATFPPAMHFFKAKERIERSKLFEIIKLLPKGASLHSHDLAMLSQEKLFEFTYEDNLYFCKTPKFVLKFFKVPDKTCNWTLVSAARKQYNNFDAILKSRMSLIVDNPRKQYEDINAIWSKFNEIFRTVMPLLTFKPVFEKYFYQVLEELHQDNVMYVEFRGLLPTVYDLDGTQFEPLAVVGFYKSTVERFKNDYPDFIGAKFIFAPSRKVDDATVVEYLNLYSKLKLNYPDFVAGFDLVGQEDAGRPLVDFVPLLLPKNITTFYHAGETNWFGSTDENVIDALLLNTKRIGHGYALIKHPRVLRAMKQRNIAIEVSPLSNQVLMLVDDLRNHPANVYIATGMPVVICNDDPTFWGAKGLSYDWYVAFLGMTNRRADLRFLKQLAMNSLEYSTLAGDEKDRAKRAWGQKWTEFIDKINDHGTASNLVTNA